jgi:23S rRNA (pseudouridine1915-N3)-methyltransferase
MEKALDPRGKTVALEIEGEAWSSRKLADFVGRCEGSSVPSITFLIGGAYGLPPELSRAAHVRLSLSAMTLPHRLARVVLVEQIYRAFTILRGEPYSHD